MTAKNGTLPQMSMKNTKQELLAAYNELLKKVQESQKRELKPEKKIKEKQEQRILEEVNDISGEKIAVTIHELKSDIVNMLTGISEKLEEEVSKLEKVQKAIEIKERELKEVYEIEKSAATLAALIEAQRLEREKFEQEMAKRKDELSSEIEKTRQQWKEEKKRFEEELKDRRAVETKKLQREMEEFRYKFEREKQLARDKFEDEKAALLAEQQKIRQEMKQLKETTEKELAEREENISKREKEFAELKAQVGEFPKKLERAVAEAVKEVTEKIKTEAKFEKELLKKQYEGERNVLLAKIESLERTVKEQSDQIAKLSEQHEMAYQKVQEVAVKAIEGASKGQQFTGLRQVISEQGQGGEA